MIRNKLPRVTLEQPARRHQGAFLEAVRRSRSLHRPWLAPPSTPEAYRGYLKKLRSDRNLGHLVISEEGDLAGYININEIVFGGFRSGYLGYGAFVPHAGHGLMAAGLRLVIRSAFREQGLHRLEANIQPGNESSRALASKLDFRLEGVSERYLKIGGRWRDHERWALVRP